MPLTYLTQEDKLRSLIYVSNYELSPNVNVQNKQFEVLKVFWNNYIKECDYFPYVRTFKHEKYGRIYTFDWDIKKLDIDECNRLINEFNYRNEKYVEITQVLLNELSRIHYPSLVELRFVNDFTKIHNDWMIKDPEEYVDMFNNKYYLGRLSTCIYH